MALAIRVGLVVTKIAVIRTQVEVEEATGVVKITVIPLNVGTTTQQIVTRSELDTRRLFCASSRCDAMVVEAPRLISFLFPLFFYLCVFASHQIQVLSLLGCFCRSSGVSSLLVPALIGAEAVLDAR